MDRREALRTIAATATLTIGGIEPPKPEYAFKEELRVSGEIWRIYNKMEHATPVILCPKTFQPYRPFTPILVELRYAIKADGTAITLPTCIVGGQMCRCYNLEDPDKVTFITTPLELPSAKFHIMDRI